MLLNGFATTIPLHFLSSDSFLKWPSEVSLETRSLRCAAKVLGLPSVMLENDRGRDLTRRGGAADRDSLTAESLQNRSTGFKSLDLQRGHRGGDVEPRQDHFHIEPLLKFPRIPRG